MRVTLDREGKNLVKLGLELEPERAIKAYEQTCRQISQKANIPGFRKGKAPRSVVEKTFGIEYIKQEALERLVPQLLSEAISKESLDIITEPEIGSLAFDLGEPLKFEAKFEIRPPVQLGNYKGIKVEVPELKKPDDALDVALANLAESRTEMKAIDSREVVLSDHVLIDFECMVEDKLVDGGKAQGLLLEVKEDAFLPGFCEQLIGKKPGEKIDISARFPEDYRNKALAGKDAIFKTEIKELRQKVTPELNDELAKSFGISTLDELKKSLTERIDADIEEENLLRKHRYVVEAIVKNSNVDIPESMIEREQELLLKQVKRQVEQNQQSWEEFEKLPEYATIKTAKYEEAKQRVLTSLVLGAILREEKVTVSPEEAANHMMEVIERNNLPADKALSNENFKRQIMEEALTGKVIDLIVQQAEVTHITNEPAQESENPKIKDKEKKQKVSDQ